MHSHFWCSGKPHEVLGQCPHVHLLSEVGGIAGLRFSGVHTQVLIAQLNIRMRLEAEGKNVGIVAEKMAYGGTTRFEDLARLPLGISVNFTSFSAKMLAFLAYYPKLLVPFFALGEEADITVRPPPNCATKQPPSWRCTIPQDRSAL